MTQGQERDDAEAGATTSAERRSWWRLNRRNTISLAVLAFVAVVVLALNLITVPVVILRPGPATNTLGTYEGKEVISISGAKTYPTSGALDFTTVSVAGGPNYPVSVAGYLKAKLFEPDAQIDPEEAWFPKNITGEEVKRKNLADMTDSQETAEVVAMRAAGLKVPERIFIGEVAQDGPVAGVLKAKDRLLEIDGRPVTTLESVHTTMAKVTPGSTVPVVVQRAGKRVTVQARTTTADGDRAVFGIALDPQYQMPAEVKVNVGEVGGPSAGMMFTLAIYDKLTPGALTGGKRVAGTGTIDSTGRVGPIGGISHKMIGAREAGAEYFLAPESDCAQVRGKVPDGLTVIKVATLQDALDAMPAVAKGAKSGFPGC